MCKLRTISGIYDLKGSVRTVWFMSDALDIYERLRDPARHPREITVDGDPLELIRSFAFVDLTGFTAYCALHGPGNAQIAVRSFRKLIRRICSQRGVRVSKWLGDGAMLVGTEVTEVVACALDIVSRVQEGPLGVRGGVSTGPVLLLDGDDYIGRAINLASRLCDLAEPQSVYIDGDSTIGSPVWSIYEPCAPMVVRGLGLREDIGKLTLSDFAGVSTWGLGV